MIVAVTTGMVFGIGGVAALIGAAAAVFFAEAMSETNNTVEIALDNREPITLEEEFAQMADQMRGDTK